MGLLPGMNYSVIDLRLRGLLGNERGVQVDFLLCLGEFDDSKGWDDLGYANLWDYCRRELGLLECSIARRIQAMRILRRFPVVESYLRDGRLCMTGIGMLERVLTDENHREIFDRASGKNTREIAEISVLMNEPVEVKTVFRKVPVSRQKVDAPFPSDPRAEREVALDGGDPSQTTSMRPPAPDPTPAPVPTPKPRVVPVAPQQFRLTAILSEEENAKIDRAKKIFSHQVPDGNVLAVMMAAIDVVIALDDKKHTPKPPKSCVPKTNTAKNSATSAAGNSVANDTGADATTSTPVVRESERERATVSIANFDDGAVAETASASRESTVVGVLRADFPSNYREYISVEIERALWARDGDKCVWILANGEKCGSEYQLEGDHIIPVAKGGRSTLDNLRLLCRAHNLMHARREFGDAFMARFHSLRRVTTPPFVK